MRVGKSTVTKKTADIIRDNSHLLKDYNTYDFLCRIPYKDLKEVTDLIIKFGVSDPFDGHYITAHELGKDIFNYGFPAEGTTFRTLNETKLSLESHWSMGYDIVDYIKNVCRLNSNVKNADKLLAELDEALNVTDLSDDYIDKINEALIAIGNRESTLYREPGFRDVALIISHNASVQVVDITGDNYMMIGGIPYSGTSAGMKKIRITFESTGGN